MNRASDNAMIVKAIEIVVTKNAPTEKRCVQVKNGRHPANPVSKKQMIVVRAKANLGLSSQKMLASNCGNGRSRAAATGLAVHHQSNFAQVF